MADVARVAGVAKSTVSRVMSNDETLHVPQETRQRIRDAIRQLDFVPNASAQGLRRARSNSIAFIVPELDNYVFSQTILGAQQALISSNYSLLIAHLDPRKTDRELYRRIVLRNRVDGLLINTVQDEDLMANVRRLDTRYLLVNRRTEFDPNAVTLDNGGGAIAAVRHLVELGHRRIAYVSGPIDQFTHSQRFEGYRQGCEAMGLAYDEALVRFCQLDRDEAMAAGHDILAKAEVAPSAIIAGSLLQASGLIAALQSRGLSVPQDVSLLSLTGGPAAELMTPRISTVDQPYFDLGWTAATALLDLVEGRAVAPVQQVVAARGVLSRDSTAARRA